MTLAPPEGMVRLLPEPRTGAQQEGLRAGGGGGRSRVEWASGKEQ